LSAARSFKPREISASRCRQKGSITDEVIELHVAVLHRTQISPPMVELGHERLGEVSCRFSYVRNVPLATVRPEKGGLS
jgi:hypothetical protein